MALDFAAAYDELNPADHDYRFYTALAVELGATSALDLGCGTGTLARLLAARGLRVVGIDPDPAMVREAGRRSGAVDWRLGFSDCADPGSADFAVMSGHVAQVFRHDAVWSRTLRDLHRALVPGGTLAFESRNPSARSWERWSREATLRTVGTPDGPVEFWHETAEVTLPLVAYDTFTRNTRTGELTSTRDVLAFRDAETLRRSVQEAGFQLSFSYGDWDGKPEAVLAHEVIIGAVSQT
ncbi:class I SAM-dependent methyltransferase [Actinoplanes sp. TRM 88003]|uniref:Class I SAM-dependent methyltransferase n=1 Tax=Paractinoplanes aksuensis TaxID=2939490 RepID=A0ABT1DFU7_9ACTN|nr:class I SAM-dependent methyltransferase [Actinoplanes aksuensis]MCO8269669.1 class I SAM-dependent methyltransferase [Actinoplanes aksuensis]